MILETATQRDADWYAARIGKATASRFKDAIATKKQTEKQKKDNLPGDPMQAQLDYLTELVVERLTQQPIQRYATAAMQWGTEQEPAARAAYERVTGISVEETGFICHDTLLACLLSGTRAQAEAARYELQSRFLRDSAGRLKQIEDQLWQALGEREPEFYDDI